MTSMSWATEDWHTAGEPFRIVADVPTPGASVADRRAHGSWQRPLAQERCVLSPGSRTSR